MANGSILAGFLQGYTGRSLDAIDQRRKDEQEAEKLRLLETLRRETAEWEEGLPSKVQSRKESESRIAENAAQAKRDSERLALDRDKEIWDRGMDEKRFGLQQSEAADLKRYRNESLSNERKRLGLDTTSSDGDSASKVADALKTRYKDTIDTLVADSDIDPLTVNQYALEFVNRPNVRGNLKGAELENAFLDGLNRLRFDERAKKSRYK